MLIDKRKSIKLVAISLLLLLSRYCCCCHQQLTALLVRPVPRPRKWALMLHIICCSLSVPRQLRHPSLSLFLLLPPFLSLSSSRLTTIFFGACFCFAQFVEPFTTNVRARPTPLAPPPRVATKKLPLDAGQRNPFCAQHEWMRQAVRWGKGAMDSEWQTKWNETSWGCRRWQGGGARRCCIKWHLLMPPAAAVAAVAATLLSLLLLLLLQFLGRGTKLISVNFNEFCTDSAWPYFFSSPPSFCPAHAPFALPPTICFCFICVFAFCF